MYYRLVFDRGMSDLLSRLAFKPATAAMVAAAGNCIILDFVGYLMS